MTDDTMPASQDAPIANFSQCHVGIIGHLDALGELPALMEPAQRARKVAADMLAFFDAVILEHHGEEERELFPAVLQSAAKGREHEQVRTMVERLTTEHRQIEAWWSRIKPQLRQIAKGHDTTLDTVAVQQLVKEYHAHARYEETEFLPLSQAILGRNANHMAALGMSLHMRHTKPVPGYI
ncbi:MAG: hemerythrin domain-containing protein [Burkholderiaceae bacterium]|nr:hemerythrin domain-containing protein [Rhodoferax sp.]MCB2007795.1 hemerythrin domain-containing protein [Rhodoferax sp.]MCB2031054.1 hemerythrin domain-containing protein [Rhodoferax sp.]MCB2041003.1 hemerythrin domain-containing protein [Rhodoferax sp.]